MTGDALFWIGLCALAYAYLGYPLLLALIAPALHRHFQEGEQTPAVSLIVAAHNQAAVIAEKIEHTLALDYPGRSAPAHRRLGRLHRRHG